MSKTEAKTETKKDGQNDVKILTTSWGAPVADNQNSLTVGPNGPILIQDVHLFDKLAHFARERIPERVVHAKGAGAHGYFEVTNKDPWFQQNGPVSNYCKAKYLSQTGKRTPVFLRFSTVGGERGSSDLARDPRGFALKHYTEEGNYDMVGNNTPIFFIRDPIKFPDFIHTQKRDPVTNCGDPNMIWDFAGNRPESIHQFSFLFSDRGIPYSYRHMNGYSSHTYKWVNAQGNAWWVKLHYKTDAGIKCFTNDEAKANGDADWATRDLFNWIASGKEATWTAQVQLMPVGEEKNYKWNIFDVTKVWPHQDYPPREYGRLVLNRNPTNYFAEVEQSAFAPAHLVPGVEASLDRMLQGRLFSYSDTHRHRLGVNSTQLPINCPMNVRVTNGQRDGFATINNQDAEPNYEPNTIPNSAQQQPQFAIKQFDVVNPTVGTYDQLSPSTDYLQPQTFWLTTLSSDERARLASNIAGSLGHCRQPIIDKMLGVFDNVDKSYGDAIRAAIAKQFPKYTAKMM